MCLRTRWPRSGSDWSESNPFISKTCTLNHRPPNGATAKNTDGSPFQSNAFEYSFFRQSPSRNASTPSAMRRSAFKMWPNVNSATATTFIPRQWRRRSRVRTPSPCRWCLQHLLEQLIEATRSPQMTRLNPSRTNHKDGRVNLS